MSDVAKKIVKGLKEAASGKPLMVTVYCPKCGHRRRVHRPVAELFDTLSCPKCKHEWQNQQAKAKKIDDYKPEPWSARRWNQVDELEQLLNECGSINTGNNIVRRLKRIIYLSQKLRTTDCGRRRASFLSFLQEHARYGCASQLRAKRPSP